MTGAEFSAVDFDLLADYVGGALAGTPEEAEVAARVAADPAWRAAHDELSTAMAAVGSDLNAWGAAAEPMPADLVARLDFALASPAADPSPIDPELAAPTRPYVVPSPASDRHPVAVPSRSLSGRSRRRRMRWAAPLAAAAGVIAFLGIGAGYLANRSQGVNDSATSSAAGSSAENAPMMQSGPVGLPSGDQIQSTGTDYTRGTLALDPPRALSKPDDSTGGSRAATHVPSPDKADAAGSLDSALARLRAPQPLLDCLTAITSENAGGPITVQTVDYARYAGNPALVIRFTAANGSFAWASGPDCGTPGAGAATLDKVKVG